MPSMGINLVECSLVKEYDRDALSRTLAGEPNIYTYSRCRAHRSFKVEVLVSAIDGSTGPHSAEPDIIMIFSGDGAILHPISLLTLRGYTVFLVVPEQSDHSTSSRATRVFDWNTDILDIKQQRSPASVSMVSIGSQSGPSVTSHKASGTTHSFSVSNLGTPISSSIVNTFSTSPPMSPRIATQKPPPPHISSGIAASMSTDLFRATPNTAITPKTKPTVVSALPEPSDPCVSSVVDQNLTNQSFSSPSKSGQDLTGSSKHSSGLKPLKPNPLQQFETLSTDGWAINSGWNEDGGWEISNSDWSVEPKKRRLQQEVVGRAGLAIAEMNPLPTPDLPSHMRMPPPESSPTDNTVFLPLLQCLRKARAEGKNQLLLSVMGLMLSKDIYRAAGVPSLGGYVTLAAQKGVVNFGGIGAKKWVSLK